MEVNWSTVEDLENMTSEAEITATGLCMWGNCYLENPPEHFGKWMVTAGEKLGISPTFDGFMKYSEKFMGEKNE